ncbi:MAG: hypothetical protein ABSB76_12815 [Streptosporangiaceae bacterium]
MQRAEELSKTAPGQHEGPDSRRQLVSTSGAGPALKRTRARSSVVKRTTVAAR